MPPPDHAQELDREILDRIDLRTQRTEDHVQELYAAVVGTLGEPGMQERQRDHERRLTALETWTRGRDDDRRQGRRTVTEKLVALITSLLVSITGTLAYLKLSGKL